MNPPHDKSPRVTRRGFLKFAAFTAAGVTLGKSLRDYAARQEFFNQRWGDGPGIETWKISVCRQCPAGCGLRVRLVDGDAKKLDGNPLCPIARGTTCPKGQAGLQSLYNPDRLVGPARRTGRRGAGQWQRISWEEALAEVQAHLSPLRNDGKPQAVAWIAERNDGIQGQIIRRFMRAYGSPNLFEFIDHRDDAARAAMYFCQGVDELPAYDMENTRFILSLGTPVLGAWLSPTWMARQYGNLRRGNTERRGRFVQVEPRMSATAIKADEWIPINPGTETALALALAHVMIREDLYDREFVDTHTFGFADWKDANGREHEGFRTTVLRDYAPGTVSPLTGVPVTTILRLARELAANRPAVVVGEQAPLSGGISQAWAVHALNALNGMVDRPGGVLTQRELPLKPLPAIAPDAVAQRGLSQPLVMLGPMMNFPASATALPLLSEAIAEGRPYQLDTLFVSNSRFFDTSPEAGRFFKAVHKIPFIVSFSSALDDSAAFADLILPDHSPLEKWVDAAPLPVDGTPVWAVSAPALDPILDTRQTGEAVMDLGRRLGGSIAEAFPWQDYSAVLKFAAEGLFEARRGTPFTTPYESSWIQQLEAGGWWIPSADNFEEFWKQLVDNGGWFDPIYQHQRWRRVFRTPSAKFEFVSQTLAARWQQPQLPDVKLMPQQVPPVWTGEPHEFPFKLRVFTVLATGGLEDPNQPFLAESLAPQMYARWENWVELNPETARRLGIREDDRVWVESPLGKIQLRVRLFAGLMPDVVSTLIGHEHRDGGGFVTKAGNGVADLVVYRADVTGLGVVASSATTRVKVYKA